MRERGHCSDRTSKYRLSSHHVHPQGSLLPPPAVLRAALEASEKRVERERDKITKEMCQLQKRLDELEKGPDIPKREEPEKPAASESKGVKRRRVGSSSDESVEAVDVDEWYDRQWPIAKARKPGKGSRK